MEQKEIDTLSNEMGAHTNRMEELGYHSLVACIPEDIENITGSAGCSITLNASYFSVIVMMLEIVQATRDEVIAQEGKSKERANEMIIGTITDLLNKE